MGLQGRFSLPMLAICYLGLCYLGLCYLGLCSRLWDSGTTGAVWSIPTGLMDMRISPLPWNHCSFLSLAPQSSWINALYLNGNEITMTFKAKSPRTKIKSVLWVGDIGKHRQTRLDLRKFPPKLSKLLFLIKLSITDFYNNSCFIYIFIQI